MIDINPEIIMVTAGDMKHTQVGFQLCVSQIFLSYVSLQLFYFKIKRICLWRFIRVYCRHIVSLYPPISFRSLMMSIVHASFSLFSFIYSWIPLTSRKSFASALIK
jgi:hypothetical protein